MSYRTDLNALFVSTTPKDFDKRKEKEFLETIRGLDKLTTVTEVTDAHCLLMAPNGELRIDGVPHRFTRQALSVICSIICTGLFPTLTDIAGIVRPDRAYARNKGQDRNFFSLRTAIDFFNAAVKLRFDAVSPLRVVRNTQTQLVDGLIRGNYQWVSHVELWELVRDMTAGKGYEFSYGRVAGRHAMFRLLHPYPIYKDSKQSIRHGIQVINSEHASSSIRIGRCYVRAPRMVGCWTVPNGVKHAGTGVLQKAAGSVQTAMHPEKWEGGIKDRIDALRKQVVDSCTTKDFPEKGLRSFGEKLRALRFSREVWERARNHRAIVDESAMGFTVPPMTAYDLWCALGEKSQAMPILRQDALERIAYEYLSGKISFVVE